MFAETWCSSCGASQGPGDEGVSHCDMHRAQATKVQRDSRGWTLDDDLTPLTPMRADDSPVPRWWRAVTALLDDEPFYEFGEVR